MHNNDNTPPQADPLGSLRSLLRSCIDTMLGLDHELETAFRAYYRAHAVRVLRYSIYGFFMLYLLVVTPVLLWLPAGAGKELWAWSAVLPIGAVLACLYVLTRLGHSEQIIEPALTVGLYICLLGTLYCTLRAAGTVYGMVAGSETILVSIIAFSVLRLSIRLSLGATLLAFFSALALSLMAGDAPAWLAMLLFFWAPLSTCTVSGIMLEYAARREFVLSARHKAEKEAVLRDIAAKGNETDEIDAVLETALALLCTYRGWPGARAYILDPDSGRPQASIRHVAASAEAAEFFRRFTGKDEDEGPPLVVLRACASGQLEADHLRLERLDGAGPAWGTHLASPVKIGNEVVAVLEFLADLPQPIDNFLPQLMEQVGQQLSHVFTRQRMMQLLDRATHDPLTGLPNRSYLLERVQAAIARARRKESCTFCVLYMDLDHFKWINDSLGHGAGDAVLVELARRLRISSRPSDVVARLGGDEFVILMEDVASADDAISAANRIHSALRRPLTHEAHVIKFSGSVGIALGDPRYDSPEAILRDADAALYIAKQRGRGCHVVFTPALGSGGLDRAQIAGELDRAIREGELALLYQPLVMLDDGLVTGFEALVRWNHPQLGLLSPDSFIPVAEESGSIGPLTRWVLDEACRQTAAWNRELTGRAEAMVSVNLPAVFFFREGLVGEITSLLRAHGLGPACLRLEITETGAMENITAAMANIRELRELGVLVSLDDFGTGYSSLSHLARLGAHSLKIDRSFIRHMEDDERDRVIVNSVTQLATQLQMQVVAEGVETVAQATALRELGCRHGQGFLFARPLDPRAAATLLQEQLRDGRPVPLAEFRAKTVWPAMGSPRGSGNDVLPDTYLHEVAERVFVEFLGLPLWTTDEYRPFHADCASMVEISGTWNGSIVIACSEQLARHAAAGMLHQSEDSLTPELWQDVLMEMANIIGGNLKAALPQPARLGLPLILEDWQPPQTAQTITYGGPEGELQLILAAA